MPWRIFWDFIGNPSQSNDQLWFSICPWNGPALFAARETPEPNRSETRIGVSSVLPAALVFCTAVDGGSISTHPRNPLKPTVFPLPHPLLRCRIVQVNHIYYPARLLPPDILLVPVRNSVSVPPSSLGSHGWGCITSLLPSGPPEPIDSGARWPPTS